MPELPLLVPMYETILVKVHNFVVTIRYFFYLDLATLLGLLYEKGKTEQVNKLKGEERKKGWVLYCSNTTTLQPLACGSIT